MRLYPIRRSVRSLIWGLGLISLISASCAPAAPPAPTSPPAPLAPPVPAAAPPTQAPATKPAPEVRAAAAPAQETKPGESSEWVIAMNEEPPAADPNFGTTTSAAGGLLFLHIYNPLYDFEAIPDGSGFRQKPMLAESYRLINDTTWEFKLRKGVKFQNGDEFTAEDVKYTFDDYLAEKTLRTTVKNAVERVDVVDPSTIRITTRGVQAGLIAILAGSPMLPQKARSQVGAEAFNQKPIGTGPYKLAEWVKGQRLVLEANPDYWEGRVSPQRLVLRIIPDPTTRVAELRTGGAQIMASPAAGQLKELEANSETQLVAMRQIGKGGRAQHYLINATRKPFDDVRVRQAVNYAVDRDGILKNVLEGRGELLHGPFSSGWPGYDRDLKPYPYDPARARQLLVEAGYPSGFETELHTSSGVWLKDREISEVIANQLGEVGIKARLVPKEVVKLFADRLAGNFEGITLSPWATFPDPDPMLGIHFYRAKTHNDDRLNALIEKQRNTVEPAERLKAIQELGRYLHEQGYILEVHSQDEFWARRRDLPWTPLASGGSYMLLYRLTPRS